jgi:hypothetical protein
VQFGRPARQRSRRLGTLLLACLVAAAMVLVVARSGSHRRAAPPPPVTVTNFGHPILGLRGGWQLIGLDANGVVAVEFARGQIVRTSLPRLAGDGIVSLVPASGEVLVRPLDNVPGYVVPDGEPARPLTGVLAHGGYLLPGPTPAQQWLDYGELMLVGPGGKPEHSQLPEAAMLWATQVPVISDGHGGLILTGASGTVYDANDSALRPISALPFAVGPRNWLGLQCDNGNCSNVVISAATGVARTLPGPASYADPWPWRVLPGVASPDGTSAAVIVPGKSESQARLDLVNMNSGAVLQVPVPVAQDSSSRSLAWSPDSRWLFVVTAYGGLAIVNARTGQPGILSLGLSGLRQIVIRPAAG